MLVKHNNNSISDITSAGQLAQGKMTLISSQTASGSASIEFTSGIDSTYPIYRFEFINMHPASDNVNYQFNLSTDGGSNYNVTKTSSAFGAYHNEGDTETSLSYALSRDLAQSTAFQDLNTVGGISNDSDHGLNGYLHLFNPSSTTFVKHFLTTINYTTHDNFSGNSYTAGYGNNTSSIDAIKFQMSSGNIDSGKIKLYGIKGD